MRRCNKNENKRRDKNDGIEDSQNVDLTGELSAVSEKFLVSLLKNQACNHHKCEHFELFPALC